MKYTVDHPTVREEGIRGRLSSPLHITGHVPMHFGRRVRYEGTYEKLFLETLDFNASVKAVWPQPLAFRFTNVPDKKKYTPDFLVEYSVRQGERSFRPTLVEVKARADLKAERESLLPGFRAATDYCREQGWRFRIVTDVYLKRPYAENARFLSLYLRNDYDAEMAYYLKQSLHKVGPVSVYQLLEASFSDYEDRMRALAVTWHLVATRQFAVSLFIPLNMNSLIWEVSHGKA